MPKTGFSNLRSDYELRREKFQHRIKIGINDKDISNSSRIKSEKKNIMQYPLTRSQMRFSAFLCYFVAVLGALIGKQKGRSIEIMNSFELVFHKIEDEIIIDREYYNLKEDQCKF